MDGTPILMGVLGAVLGLMTVERFRLMRRIAALSAVNKMLLKSVKALSEELAAQGVEAHIGVQDNEFAYMFTYHDKASAQDVEQTHHLG